MIGCERRTLGELLPIAGTGMSLVYASDRMPGYREELDYDVPLSDSVDPSLLSQMSAILMRVSVAGRTTVDTFPVQANLHARATWDGKDAYGRLMQGKQRMVIEVGYAYAVPFNEPIVGSETFGQNSGTPMSVQARTWVVVWQTVLSRPVGIWDNRGAGLGGWSLSALHGFDPYSGTLYLGTGERRSAAGANPALTELATSVDPGALVTTGDGGVIYWDFTLSRLFKIDRDGNKTIFAGNGSTTYSGDGGLAINAGMDVARIARGPDGTIYFSDRSARFRKITRDGNCDHLLWDGCHWRKRRWRSGDTGDSHRFDAARGRPRRQHLHEPAKHQPERFQDPPYYAGRDRHGLRGPPETAHVGLVPPRVRKTSRQSRRQLQTLMGSKWARTGRCISSRVVTAFSGESRQVESSRVLRAEASTSRTAMVLWL